MKDGYGRTIDYLRISITDRCNLRCTYCMPEEGIPYLAHGDILTYEEIETICRAMAQIGLKHVRITGGEPLVRRQCWRLVKKLRRVPGLQTVTLTTNGILLEEQAQQLVAAGLDGVNISLDTLDAAVYRSITRCGDVSRVLAGLEQMQKYPQVTVKLNCVLGGVQWEQTAVAVAGLAKRCPVHVRFIERMPLAEEDTQSCAQDDVLAALEAVYGAAQPCEKPMGFGPSTYVQFAGFLGKVGFISAVSHKFCADCNRIRLTADGKLRLCLQSDRMVDLRALVRGGRTAELISTVQEALKEKPQAHCFEQRGIETACMSRIGG
ncbi:GTP 3',8-cyclase MoaA [Butyricicoccus porcorum]|uniref:GTP 3',8-cyclase MoaA n=1 Tax=Butyricicoccus porcorum TaxID=1945634 RepID=UPI003F4AA9F9